MRVIKSLISILIIYYTTYQAPRNVITGNKTVDLFMSFVVDLGICFFLAAWISERKPAKPKLKKYLYTNQGKVEIED